LAAQGVPHAAAAHEASAISQSQGRSGRAGAIPHFVRLDFAYATHVVLYVMSGIMVAAALVAVRGLRRGVQEEPAAAEAAA
jgi:hypothetical protein